MHAVIENWTLLSNMILCIDVFLEKIIKIHKVAKISKKKNWKLQGNLVIL